MFVIYQDVISMSTASRIATRLALTGPVLEGTNVPGEEVVGFADVIYPPGALRSTPGR